MDEITEFELGLISKEVVYNNDSVPEEQEQFLFENNVNIKEKSFEYLYNKRYNQNTKLRKQLACWAKDLISTYLVLVLFILCFNNYLIKLDKEVLITLLGTTTLNVLGLMYIAMKDLFNGNSEDKK